MERQHMAIGNRQPRRKLRMGQKWIPYLFISPFFIAFIIFTLGPTIYSLRLSFSEWYGVGPIKYIGLDNFIEIAKSPYIMKSFRNVLIIAAYNITIPLVLALIVALMMNSKLTKYPVFSRAVLFSPGTLSAVFSVLMFRMILNTRFGLLNNFLSNLGIPPLDWLGSTTLALPSVLIIMTWASLGGGMVFFLAGLQSIPREYYEIASIDGANAWRSFLNVTLPFLRPMIIYLVTTGMIGCFSTFSEPFLLTRGGPLGATYTPAMAVYQYGFVDGRMGFGSAIAYVIALATFIAAFFLFKYVKFFKEGD